ncbi:hypothetical protein TRFO_31640 [Tritrichomonas foetus]|uniref:Uncharacterized protein n=1 Tax=Tritrichomonas foetus TaxID=1144522 RepID=A0A1J4JRW8_9EUKA|nr:hypothetical protein TRFO_31640 [Tritrichomonas foetus]|eukprot:OHT01498.1 hypothetical protein TRFO_31640 [Tritrichomonas foetus]
MNIDKSSSSPPPNSNEVQVHLVVHQQNEDLKIDFSFDKINDDIDSVVSELIETLGMTESDKGMIKASIEAQINSVPKANPSTSFSGNEKADQYFEPILENQPADQSDEDSDDSDITDPEYRALVEQQNRDMQSLLAHHLSERKELAQRIQASLQHQQHQPAPNSLQPNPPLQIVTNQSHPHQAPSQSAIPPINPPSSQQSLLCDDLIVFS